MASVSLRQAVRAIVLDHHDRLLLCRLAIPKRNTLSSMSPVSLFVAVFCCHN